jgi:hypothetical protein
VNDGRVIEYQARGALLPPVLISVREETRWLGADQAKTPTASAVDEASKVRSRRARPGRLVLRAPDSQPPRRRNSTTAVLHELTRRGAAFF